MKLNWTEVRSAWPLALKVVRHHQIDVGQKHVNTFFFKPQLGVIMEEGKYCPSSMVP